MKQKEVEYLLFIYFHEEHKNLHLFELIQKKQTDRGIVNPLIIYCHFLFTAQVENKGMRRNYVFKVEPHQI